MRKTIKRALGFIFANIFALTVSAQYATDFRVTEVADDELAFNIDTAISGLLTAFNNAQGTGDVPHFSGIDVADKVRTDILKLWADCPFRCRETRIAERAIKTPRGEYQVRNIPLVMMPIEGESKDPSWKKYQEAVFTLDKNGMVTDFHLALNANLYVQVMNAARTVEDVEKRMLILEYVERFRNAYNLKDMDFLKQVFSEDALIITGKVVKVAKSEINKNNMKGEKIVYSRQNKEQYLSKLAIVFKNNKRINVMFDEVEVAMHPVDVNYYGVTLKQSWNSDGYSDEGHLFLLWDFSNPDMPQIHVRTWQPEEWIKKTGEKVFSMDDFNF